MTEGDLLLFSCVEDSHHQKLPLEGKLAEPIRRIPFQETFVRLSLMRGTPLCICNAKTRRIQVNIRMGSWASAALWGSVHFSLPAQKWEAGSPHQSEPHRPGQKPNPACGL